jgi:hypothetical protein
MPFVFAGLAACGGATNDSGSEPGPKLGPTAGDTQRFSVDRVEYPDKPADFAVDLNGDGLRENHLALVLGVLRVSQNDPAAHVQKLIAAGRFAPVVEVTSRDATLQDSSHVRLRVVEGGVEATVEGTLSKGTFSSTRAFRSKEPLTGQVRIPIFTDSDPVVLPIVGVELALRVENDGTLSGSVHGAVRKVDLETKVLPEVHRAFGEMVTTHPELHTQIVSLLDRDADGKVSYEEFKNSALVQSFLKMDVQLFDERGAWAPNPKNTTPDSMSLGFGFHARPAASAPVVAH